MDKLVDCYEIRLPMDGQPDGLYTACRALSTEGAVEVIRALLALRDQSIQRIEIRCSKTLMSEV